MSSPSITDPQDEAEEPVDAEPEPVAGNICEIIFAWKFFLNFLLISN